jgi:cytochrome P450
LSHRGRLGPFYWLANTPGFRKACRTSHAFVDAAVQRALDTAEKNGGEASEADKQYVFIDALVRETRDKKALRNQCLNVLLAGRDTTACCLSWTLRLLARHPSVLDKLRTEVESVVGLGPDAPQPTREQLKKMKYLDLVLKEVLRLYPSVPVNSRAALKTTTLPIGGGQDGQSPVLVRRGEPVGYCVYAMHRRKDLYGDDAMHFVLERWENGELAKRIGYGYLPFNGGPRVCLGQDFALLEAGYTVVRTIQRYPYITLPKGGRDDRGRKGETDTDISSRSEKWLSGAVAPRFLMSR